MFEINEVINELSRYSELEKLADGTGISAPKVKEFIESVRLPDSYGYEFTEWNEILGCKIDEQNAKKCGMVKLLADILFEITIQTLDLKNPFGESLVYNYWEPEGNIQLNSSLSATVFAPCSDEDYIYLVMPMQLRG